MALFSIEQHCAAPEQRVSERLFRAEPLLAAAELFINDLPPEVAKRLPKYPVPCYRLGRLAVSERHHGRGVGSELLGSAIKRCLEAKRLVASCALIVDALDTRAQRFYGKHGFQPLASRPMTLWIPLPDA